MSNASKQEVALGERQNLGRITDEKFTVGPDLIGFRIDFDMRSQVVVDHLFLTDVPDSPDRHQRAVEAEPRYRIALQPRLTDEGDGTGRQRPSDGAEHGAVMD